MFKSINKIKFLYLILIILVGSFELYTFSRLFHPNVSDLYKLYYIDKKLYSWEHGKGIQYDRGSKLNNLTIKRFLSRTGWTRDDNTHSWKIGKASEIYFQAKDVNKYKGVLSLNLTSVKEQEIEVIINNKYITNKIIRPPNMDILLYFKPEILNENRINTIKFNNKSSYHNRKDKNESLAINLNTIEIY